MFGIGGGELIFIVLIALMLFGADKIPDIARTLGKGMAQLKNATDDIKHEITKSADLQSINKEIANAKQGFNNLLEDQVPDINVKNEDAETNQDLETEKPKSDINDIVDGPIKRSF